MSNNRYYISLEGLPASGKTTFFELLTTQKIKRERVRTEEILMSLPLSQVKLNSLFSKALPERFYSEKEIILIDLPGHQIFNSYKVDLRKSCSSSILFLNEVLTERDLLLIEYHHYHQIPFLILFNKSDVSDNRKIFLELSKRYELNEYSSTYDPDEGVFYLNWSNYKNLCWSRLIFFLFNTTFTEKTLILPEQQEKKDKYTSPYLLIAEKEEKASAISEFTGKKVFFSKNLTKSTLFLNSYSYILINRKISFNEKKVLKESRLPFIEDLNLFSLIKKMEEKSSEKIVKENILIIEIIRRFSAKKGVFLIGVKLLEGTIKKDQEVYTLKGEKIGKIASLQKNNNEITNSSLKEEYGIMIESKLKEMPQKYLIGAFIEKELKGEYSYNEKKWISYCGKNIQSKY